MIYTSERAHHSIAKAAHIAGIGRDRVCTVAVDDGLRLDPEALRAAIDDDLAAGRRPLMVAATAGTTDTGAVDPLRDCAAIAAEHEVWFHVDAAYGGFFVLTERGRRALDGIDTADSITVDGHKSLFLPFGVGALVVQDRKALVDAHEGRGAYMADVIDDDDLPHYFAMGPELTRPWRGLAVWLPLQLHGVDPFGRELDRMLDLAEWSAAELSAIDGIEVIADQPLSIVTFRATAGDEATSKLLAALNRSGRVHVSSTTIDDVVHVRLAFLSQRTSAEVANTAVELVRSAQG